VDITGSDMQLPIFSASVPSAEDVTILSNTGTGTLGWRNHESVFRLTPGTRAAGDRLEQGFQSRGQTLVGTTST
jgi:hypothetical protein